MHKITPVILCGGSGERLWPLSRKNYPKQFLNLVGKGSLFQQAATRLGRINSPLVITSDNYRFIVRQQLFEEGISEAEVVIEPDGKNTGPAILVAACHLASVKPDSIMLVMPSDHYIPDASDFADVVRRGALHLDRGQIICFGIKPNRPETGYGYIKVGKQNGGIMPVMSFTEKPDSETAMNFIKNENYFWNAGIFMMRARELLEIAAKLQPQMLNIAKNAVRQSKIDLDFIRLNPEVWANMPTESFDYAFMEKTQQKGCIALTSGWSDLGDWLALARLKENDDKDNILHGSSHLIDSENSFLWAANEGQVLTGIGLKNIIAIAMEDAVLVADRTKYQEVKTMVAVLRNKGIDQATNHERENRPWGWFKTISKGEGFHAKIIHVYPGGKLSLQSHKYRSEHWIVVQGSAKVVRGDQEFDVKTNESTYIPVGQKHQLHNDGHNVLEIIEIQTGNYFGEDDIVRYEDVYGRN